MLRRLVETAQWRREKAPRKKHKVAKAFLAKERLQQQQLRRRDVNKRKPTSAIFHLKNHITIFFRAFRMRTTKHSLAQSSKSHSDIHKHWDRVAF